MKRLTLVKVLTGLALILNPAIALAHVTLDPKEAVSGFQRYTINVPNERDIATTELRLVIPEEIEVHGILPVSGWSHKETRAATTESSSTDDHSHANEGRIQEITWSGSRLNPGEFMTFAISTRYSGEPKELVWKAYQKYADGTVVAWDDTNKEKEPAPKTTIVSTAKIDQIADVVETLKSAKNQAKDSEAPLWFSFIALLFGVAGFVLALKKR